MNMNLKKLRKKTEKLHVFFTFTPFNQLVTSAILADHLPTQKNVLVINSSEVPFRAPGIQALDLSSDSHDMTVRYLRHLKAARALLKLRDHNLIASVSAPHPHHLICNTLMLGRRHYPVNITEDGVGNYIASHITGTLKSKMIAKRLAAPLLGLEYKIYKGHFTGIDDQVMDSGYFLNPELVYQNENFRSLHKITLATPSGWKSSFPPEEKILVLDQDIESMFSRYDSKLLREKLIEYVRSLNMKTLWKFHPSQKPVMHQSLRDLNIEIIQSKEAAEVVALKHNPKYVISFFSSALKNIKSLVPNTHCIALGALEVDRDRGTSLSRLFQEFGIVVR
jgi:hypothetical protein